MVRLYTFYPCKPSGVSETFVVFELATDGEAQVHALHVLDQHPTCSRVVVWAGERKVLTRERPRDLRLVGTHEAPQSARRT